ncbi:MAG: hypothetical protein JWO40_741 [Candidatus Doudnabacteria bacterium]|nr:hypothetical protein [Candidatus Doudnabacteria bacterium]
MGQTNGVNTPFYDKDLPGTTSEDNRQLKNAEDFMDSEGIFTNDKINQLEHDASEGSLEALEELLEMADKYGISADNTSDISSVVQQLIMFRDNQDAPNTFNGTE